MMKFERVHLFAIIGLFAFFFAMTLLVIDDELTGSDPDRYRDLDSANRDSLFVFWEDGSVVGLNVDMRSATLVLGLILFVSIFGCLYIGSFGGRHYHIKEEIL